MTDHTIEIDIPDSDPNIDYHGMYDDLCEEIGDELVDNTIKENLEDATASIIEKMYSNRDQIVSELRGEEPYE